MTLELSTDYISPSEKNPGESSINREFQGKRPQRQKYF